MMELGGCKDRSQPSSPRTMRNECLWFKPCRLWYFVIAAPGMTVPELSLGERCDYQQENSPLLSGGKRKCLESKDSLGGTS